MSEYFPEPKLQEKEGNLNQICMIMQQNQYFKKKATGVDTSYFAKKRI